MRSEADEAAAIARVEHGLVPAVRVAGETRGWSIEERLRAHHTPGVAVAVIHDHRVVWAKAWGTADAASTVPLTPATLQNAASVSKMLTALAALKAVEAGGLSLDADVDSQLRDWHLPASRRVPPPPLTLAHLLSHSGGINVHGFPGYLEDEALPTLRDVLDGKPPANTPAVRQDAPAGKGFEYSGGGTMIVEELLVERSGHPFEQVVQEAVLDPFGLTHSTFAQPPAPPRWPVVARGHDFDGTVAPGGQTRFVELGAAGLWTTAADLAHLVAEIQLGLEGTSRVVSKGVATRMTTPVIALAGDAAGVGLGTFVEKHGGADYFGHDGLGQGFLSMVRATKTGGDGAVVMANGFGAGPLLLEILRSVAAEYRWPGWLDPPAVRAHLDTGKLHALSGRYASGFDDTMTVEVAADGTVHARVAFREPTELVPVAPDALVAPADGARYAVEAGPDGAPVALVRTPAAWPPSGDPVRFERRHDAKPDPLELLEAGRAREALALYTERLRAHPDDPAVGAGRFGGLASDVLGDRLDVPKALLLLRANVALHPRSAPAHVDLADGLRRSGDHAGAVAEATLAAALGPVDATLGEFDRVVLQWKLGRLKHRGVAPAAPAPLR